MQLQPLADALAKISAKTPVGSILKSRDWADVPLALRERAQFSATITSAKLLQAIQDRLQAQIALQRERLADDKAATFDRSSFIDAIRDLAEAEGLAPTDPAKQGTIQDITSIPRLGLIFDIQTQQATGYARWKLDQSPGALIAFPAWRLVRERAAKVPRDWSARWAEAGEAIAWQDALPAPWVALKTSPIWAQLSRFNTPWPPFDFNSGMGVEDVDYDEAVSLGLLKAGELPKPTGERDFNDQLHASVTNLDPDLITHLKQVFGRQIKIQDGAAWWTGDRAGKKLAIPPEQAPAHAGPPAAEEPPGPAEPNIPDLDQLSFVRSLGGSTGATLMRDAKGRQFVVKRGNSPDHVREEFTADALYRAAGIRVPMARLVQDGAGNPVKIAEYIAGQSLHDYLAGASPEARQRVLAQLHQGFHIDALLGNWDVAGASLDNILVDRSGNVWRIDNGGSLRFRAQGARKSASEWDEYPAELWSLRNPATNPQTAQLFASLDFYQLAATIRDTNFQAILDTAPPDLQPALSSRIQHLRDVANKALEYKEASFIPRHADRITEEMIGLRKAGISGLLHASLHKTDPVILADAQGRAFDNLRTARYSRARIENPHEQTFLTIKAAVTSVNFHHGQGDTQYNQSKIQAALAQKNHLAQLATSGSPAEQAMAKAYLKTIAELEAALGKPTVKIGHFAQIPMPQSQASTQPDSAMVRLAAHMRERGGDYEVIKKWAYHQGQSSHSNESKQLKRWLFERLQNVPPSSFHGVPPADILSSLSGQQRQVYDRSFEMFHAFVQEMLGRMDFPGNDRQAKLLRVLRTEEDPRAVPFRPGESGIYPRGIYASGSLFTQVFSGAKTVTAVPHCRIVGVYFLEQSPGMGDTFFYGDRENEVAYMAHGLKTRNVTGQSVSTDPPADHTKWETEQK